MSNREIQYSVPERISASSLGGEVGVESPVASPWQALHQKLRGRYIWAFLLAILGMAGGGYVGWGSTQPTYRARAMIYIAPSMPTAGDPDARNVMPRFQSFIAYQVALLNSLRATRLAMGTPAWKRTGEGRGSEAIESFEKRRAILSSGGTSHVHIHFVDPDPDTAVAGVHALIEAYQKLSADLNDANDSLEFSRGQVEILSSQLKSSTDQILTFTSEYGGVEGMEIRHRAAVNQVLETEELFAKLQGMIRDYRGKGSEDGKEEGKEGTKEEGTDESKEGAKEEGEEESPDAIPPGVIAFDSPVMENALLALDLLIAEEEFQREKLGDKNDRLIHLRRQIEVRKKRVKKLAKDWNRARGSKQAGGATLPELKKQAEGLLVYLGALQTKNRKIGQTRVDVERLVAANEERIRQINLMTKLVAQLESQLLGKGRITIASEGWKPTSYFKDKRLTHAIAGGLLGALLGVFLVLLVGLRDRRLKDVGSVDHALSRVRLLGLMPALEGDGKDGEGCDVAAHCVHQIRTFLQIGHARQGGACIGVSGPGVGSGKTTLTAALGVSFASSGTRTLLVDADLNGRGLTWRVSQLLLARARRVAGSESVEEARVDAEDPQDSSLESAMELLTLQSDASGWPEAGELTELLTQSLEGLGLREAKASGVIDDIFALADLLFPDEVRDGLASQLMVALGAEGVLTFGSPAEWIPTRVLELGTRSSGFNGSPLRHHLYRTGVDSLSFLPLRGLGQRGAVSAATMSKILERVRGEFDVALVDTGPVPGTVETSMVAANADSVVLVVSPEDHRPEAERAVAHMEEVGATIAGLVFNRAGQREIIRATSMSRSLPHRQDSPV